MSSGFILMYWIIAAVYLSIMEETASIYVISTTIGIHSDAFVVESLILGISVSKKSPTQCHQTINYGEPDHVL
jgi:hypothetical protein